MCVHLMGLKNRAMQSYSNSVTYPNIMEEAAGWFSRWAEGNRRNLFKLAYRRDPDSIMDELLIGFWIVLFLAVIVTTSFGFFYHYQIFKSLSGTATVGVMASFLFLIVVEFCKVFFGLHFARAFFNMLWFKSWYRLLFTVGVGAIVVGAFHWSIFISTKGISQINNSLKSGEIYKAAAFAPPSSIDEIDRQLSELDKAKEAGAKATWRGRTTQGGIDVIKSNTELQRTLLEQRALILETERSRHDSLTVTMVAEAAATSTLLTDYGGKAEYITMLLIVLIVLFEVIIYDKNKEEEAPQPVGK